MKKTSALLLGLFLVVLIVGAIIIRRDSVVRNYNNQKHTVNITVSKKRVIKGDTVLFKVQINSQKKPDQVNAFFINPAKGTEKLALEKNPGNKDEYIGKIILGNDYTDGFYGITAVCKYGHNQLVGKGSFLSGKIVLDYAIMSNFSDSGTTADMTDYLDKFIKAGGNAVVLHANIAAEKVWGGTTRVRAIWASKVCKNAVKPADDRIEKMLNLTDKAGIPSFISVSRDFSDSALINADYMKSIQDIINELWNMFGHHPSLIGFYSYQEGSGTYFAGYMRDFCRAVKQNNSGLLTMCAPNIDDPLLAGYLAAIDDLDIINYQAPIMTSYRPDNRKLFPNRRAKDVTSLSAGATCVRNKITLSHVEFMGYFENQVASAYLTNYNNIFNQFPSVASAYGPDGITFFSYFSCIYFNSKKLPTETEKAESGIADGLKAYNLISKEIANKSSHIALYIPYNDWCIERWTNCILPAADALRRVGISPDIIPFIPREGENILPYYPMNINKEQLGFLLTNMYVLILPDISGMQETDSELLEEFVRKGGVVMAFGPRIPYGDRFDRSKLWGAEEIKPIQENFKFSEIKVMRSTGSRIEKNRIFHFDPQVSSSWNSITENRIADFSDGSSAVFSNCYQKGKTYTISLSLKEAVNNFPDLLRDIFDEALSNYGIKRSFDIYGITDNMDISMNEDNGQYSVMVANYEPNPVNVKIKPLIIGWSGNYDLVDLKSGKAMTGMIAGNPENITTNIGGNNFIAFRLVSKNKKK
jgi:hypothetical protein